jgi:hypothetical protein
MKYKTPELLTAGYASMNMVVMRIEIKADSKRTEKKNRR